MKKTMLIFGLVLLMMVLPSRMVLAEQNSWGAGIGIPYGLMGVNVDYNIISNLDVSFGIGINPLSGLSYNMGAKLHLASEEKRFRPRISCYYGTNTIVEELGYVDEYTNYNGVTAGIGARIFLGSRQQHGLDFDLLYIISTEADVDRLEDEGYDVSNMDGIKISVGYRRFF